MSDEFATVLKSWSVEEAHLARIHLADEGIECHLADNQTVAMDWGLANAIRGVSVVVKQADAERARRILEEAPSDRAFEFQAADESPAHTIETEGTTGEPSELIDESERQNETLDPLRSMQSMRSIARPVIYLMLLPMVLWLLMVFGAILIEILSRLTHRGF